MSHVLAVLGLAAALVVLYGLRRWAGLEEEEPGCAEAERACEGCAVDPAHCAIEPAERGRRAPGSRG